MAGDWIKMRLDLQTHPKVVRILSATKADKFRVIGGLHAVWSVFDTHSSDGRLDGYSPDTLDHIIGWQGFSAAMIAVGWLQVDGEEALLLPDFDEHNGKSGKRRAEDQKRKREDRKDPQSVRKLSEDELDKKRTREEKRRIDSKPPLSPKGEKRPAICLRTFLDECAEKKERPVRDYQPLWLYAESIGLDTDMVALAWAEFCRQMLPGGVNATKRQADWRKTFRNYVEKNYLKLWAIDPDGKFFLTTAGKTAQKMQDSKEAS
jgi:hypothetical protein